MTKSREILYLAFVLIFIGLSASASAVVGISPGLYEIDFKPGLKQEFTFNIIGDSNMKFRIIPEGALSKYITVSPRSLDNPGPIRATLSLPESLDTPGDNIIYISANQQPDGRGGIYLLGNVKGIIKVRVPYPEEFATVALSATNANAGKPVTLKTTIKNLGKTDISAKTTINIFDPYNRSVASLPVSSKDIESLKSVEFDTTLNTEGYLSGYYRAEARVEYGSGKEARAQTSFRLGEFFINISGTSDNFVRNALNRFDIGIESFWSDPIEKVYANVSVLNYSNIYFSTAYADLEGFAKTNLTGYFDTTGILEDEFRAKITLIYADKTTEKIVTLRFKSEEDNRMVYYLSGVLAFLIIILGIVWIIARRSHRNGKRR